MTKRLVLLFLLFVGGAFAAPPQGQGYYPNPTVNAIQQLQGEVDSLKHVVSNHELEIRMYDEKLNSLDAIIENLRDQLNTSSKSHKDLLKGNTEAMEEKLEALDIATKGISADIRQFKTFSTEANTVLNQYKQKITDLERTVSQQNQNIEHLQAAMKALMEALGVKQSPSVKVVSEASSVEGIADRPTMLYKVKSGDSLEKIAKAHKTTVQVIKQLNNMSNDKIIVGKQIKVPEVTQ